MKTIDTVVIGAGHAGLAVSRLLTEAGRDHVVLDRGRVAERWRTERWDSLRLLTPNWMTRLPGWQLRRFRPGRIHERGRVRPAPGALRRVLRRPRRRRYDGAGARPRRLRGISGRHRPRHLAARHVVIATGPHGVPHVPAGLDAAEVAHRQPLPQPRATADPAACSWSAPRRPACRSPTNSTAPAATWSWRRVGTPGCRAATAAWTSSGGCSAPAGSPARSTRSPTRRPPGGNRRCSWSAAHRRTRDDLDLVALQARGVRLLGRFDGMTGTPSTVPARSGRRTPPTPTHGCIACSTRSTSTSPVPASPTRSCRRVRPRPLDVPAPHRFGGPRPARASAPSLVAAGYRPDYPWLRLPITGPGRQHPPAPGRHPRTGCVRRRPALPAPTRLRLHRRRTPRRADRRPSPARPVRRPSRPASCSEEPAA